MATDRWIDTWAGPYYAPGVTVPTPITLSSGGGGGGGGGSSPPPGPAPVEISSLTVPTVVYAGDPITIQAITSGPVASVTASIYGGSAALTNTAPGTWSGTLAAPPALGTYTITVTATGTSGQTASKTASIEVVQAPPRIVFSQNPIPWPQVVVTTAAPPGPLYQADTAGLTLAATVYAPEDTVAVTVYYPDGWPTPATEWTWSCSGPDCVVSYTQVSPGVWTEQVVLRGYSGLPPGNYPFLAVLDKPGGQQSVQGYLTLSGRPKVWWWGFWDTKRGMVLAAATGYAPESELRAEVVFPDGTAIQYPDGQSCTEYPGSYGGDGFTWSPCWPSNPSWVPPEGRYPYRIRVGTATLGWTDEQVVDVYAPLAEITNVVFDPALVAPGQTVTATVYTTVAAQAVQVGYEQPPATKVGDGIWQYTFNAPTTPGTYQWRVLVWGPNDPLIPDNTSGYDGRLNGYDKVPDDRRFVPLTVQ